MTKDSPEGNGVEVPRPSPRRPSRRTLLLAGAVAGGGAVAGAVVALNGDRHSPRAGTTSAPPSPSSALWADRDERFLSPLQAPSRTLTVTRTFRNAFPSTRLRDVVLLDGLGPQADPWIAATIIGPSNQLQITRSGETEPHAVLSIPSSPPPEILCMAWDPSLRRLYLSAGGALWAWSPDAPKTLTLVADVPGASALYEILVDPHGIVWGGTFPLGAVFNYLPDAGRLQVFSRVAEDTDYVRRLALDVHGTMWAGTGSRNPRLFTFPRTDPEARVEIALPEPQDSGFITALRAGPTKVRITVDGLPDVFELDSRSRTWTRRFRATGWVRTPSSEVLADDRYYMANNGQLREYGADAESTVIAPLTDSLGATLHTSPAGTLVSTASAGGFTLVPVAQARSALARREIDLTPGTSRVQSILAHEDGKLYVGGFMGTGIAAIDPGTDERWSSPSDLDIVHQVENMIGVGPRRLILGTYSWADVISCDLRDRDSTSGYKRLARFSTRYHQSRPFGLAANSTSLFVGTVPNYGRSGGILAKIDLRSGSTEWVLDSGGDGFIAGHSIVGLVADEDHVYGTTSVRNGSGLEDSEGPAQVFCLDLSTRTTLWSTSPVDSAGALFAPTLIAGWLLVADLEGINVIDPRTGRLAERHTLTPVRNDSQRAGWASADLQIVGPEQRVAHSAGGHLSLADFTNGTVSSFSTERGGPYDLGARITASATGELFAMSGSTDVVQIAQ